MELKQNFNCGMHEVVKENYAQSITSQITYVMDCEVFTLSGGFFLP